MTSAFIQGRMPVASRTVRAAYGLIGVTAITACTSVDAASVPSRAMHSTDVPSVASLKAPPGMYDAVMAQRGKAHFNQYCAQCHVKTKRAGSGPPTPYVRLQHLGSDTVFFADRSARTLEDVVVHYDETLQMHLSRAQQRDLVEYLKSH